MSRNVRWGALACLTLLGGVLRLWDLDSALWLDEIAALQTYRDLSVWSVLTHYSGSSNHLANTLLVKLSVALFGEASWTVRLPAMLFGVAQIPATYFASRVALSARASLLAAFFVALSSHHVFFSQNARGYSAHLLFSTLATGLLARAMLDGARRDWLGWLASTVLNFASLMLAAVVFAVHAAIGAVGAARGGEPSWRRFFATFGGAAGLVFLLYLPVLGAAADYLGTEYREPGVGFSLRSLEFPLELLRGLGGGLGALVIVAAPVALAVGFAGLRALARASWPLLLGLLAPPLVLGLVLASLGLASTPRHFLVLLPGAFIVAAAGTERVAVLLGRSATAVFVGVGLAFAGLSAVQLQRYYAVPKQDFPAALRWVRSLRKPGQPVAALHLATKPVAFYEGLLGPKPEVAYVREPEQLAAARAGAQPLILLVTFPRALRLMEPELDRTLAADFTRIARFPGTVGDGEVSIWLERAGTADR